MRALIRLFTALPPSLQAQRREVGASWLWTPLLGLGLGLVWFLTQQLTLSGVGPLVAGTAVIGIGTALTGGRGLRGLAATASAAVVDDEVPAGPPVEGVGAIAVTLVVVAQVALLQRVTLAPSMIVIVPMVARSVQALLLRSGDEEVGVDPPVAGAKLGMGLLTVGLLVFPLAIAQLERPLRLNGPLVGVDYLVLGVGSLVLALTIGMVTRAWLLARFGRLTPAGWHTIGLMAEVAALVVIAVRIA